MEAVTIPIMSREIQLTQGKVAIVNNEDYYHLSKYKWYAQRVGNNFYAARWSPRKKGKRHLIFMHRQLLGLKYRDKKNVDHFNHNTLDNRRGNIRVCTIQQNGRNRKSNQNSSSKFKGVSWHKKGEKWQARIIVSGRYRHLGSFESEEAAACAYDEAAKSYFGEFAYLNFKEIAV